MREKITDILKKSFKLYGYNPMETSILEYYDIAANKYAGGAEVLKETYRLKDQGERDLCLRYELTFKFAKIVGTNKGIALPIKRYEIGKVFRDGPVKSGRAREFTQCDVDVVGIKSAVVDAEFTALIKLAFSQLGIPIRIKLNNKKLLFAIFESAGVPAEKFIDCAISIDKLEKIGRVGVMDEMLQKGVQKSCCEEVFKIVDGCEDIRDSFERLNYLTSKIGENDGLGELTELLRFTKSFGTYDLVDFTPNLSRALGYYSGSFWEVYAVKNAVKSSLAAGGRWDGMINKMFGGKTQYPACGMSFGLDALYAAVKEGASGKFIKRKDICPVLLIVPIDTDGDCVRFADLARRYGVKSELWVQGGVKKALEYADRRKIPFVGVIGSREAACSMVNLKDMSSGSSENVEWKDAVFKLRRVRWR